MTLQCTQCNEDIVDKPGSRLGCKCLTVPGLHSAFVSSWIIKKGRKMYHCSRCVAPTSVHSVYNTIFFCSCTAWQPPTPIPLYWFSMAQPETLTESTGNFLSAYGLSNTSSEPEYVAPICDCGKEKHGFSHHVRNCPKEP